MNKNSSNSKNLNDELDILVNLSCAYMLLDKYADKNQSFKDLVEDSFQEPVESIKKRFVDEINRTIAEANFVPS